jgi:hypothetical protein
MPTAFSGSKVFECSILTGNEKRKFLTDHLGERIEFTLSSFLSTNMIVSEISTNMRLNFDGFVVVATINRQFRFKHRSTLEITISTNSFEQQNMCQVHTRRIIRSRNCSGDGHFEQALASSAVYINARTYIESRHVNSLCLFVDDIHLQLKMSVNSLATSICCLFEQ